MNMQAMLKQAQKLQKDMMVEKQKIEESEFSAENGFVKITMNGKKEVLSVKIDVEDDFSKEDVEVLEDMIMIAVNDLNKQIDKETDSKMAKFTNGMPGLF